MKIILNLILFLFLLYSLYKNFKRIEPVFEKRELKIIVQSAGFGTLLHCSINIFAELMVSLLELI